MLSLDTTLTWPSYARPYAERTTLSRGAPSPTRTSRRCDITPTGSTEHTCLRCMSRTSSLERKRDLKSRVMCRSMAEPTLSFAGTMESWFREAHATKSEESAKHDVRDLII